MFSALATAFPQPVSDSYQPNSVWSGTPTTFTILGVVMGLAFLTYGLWALRERRDWVPFLCFVGGFVACLPGEPMLDVFCHLWWRGSGYPGPHFDALGIQLPIFVPFVWAAYLGGTGYLGYRLLEGGLTKQRIATLWLALAAMDGAFQLIAVNLGAYKFYGAQPFEVAGVPLQIITKDATAYLIVSAGLLVLVPVLRQRAAWAISLIPGCGFVGGAVIVGWPWYLANGVTWAKPLQWLLASVSFALAVLFAYAISRVVASDSDRKLSITVIRAGRDDLVAPIGEQAHRAPQLGGVLAVDATPTTQRG